MVAIVEDKISSALRQISKAWLSKIELAKQAKTHFNNVAKQCTDFHQASAGFMWNSDYRSRFLKGRVNPTFTLTLQKAFEFVAIFGPTLYWRNPQRVITPRRPLELSPEFFEGLIPPVQPLGMAPGGPGMPPRMGGMPPGMGGMPPGMGGMPPGMGGDQQQIQPEIQQQMMQEQMQQQQQMQVQQLMEQLQKMQREGEGSALMRSRLMEKWLNYTPTEQPGGGLAQHAMRAINEALIKGRGILVPESYKMPESDLVLTGCTYRSVDDYFVDPDATGVEWEDCYWQCIRRTEPVFMAERRFSEMTGVNLSGRFQESASYERQSTFAERSASSEYDADRTQGKTHDTITYYEIYSRGGAGHRLSGVLSQYSDDFDKLGDHVYIVISPHVDFPLNCPPELLRGGVSTDKAKKAFSWPFPFWRDRRWPFCVLDFYRRVSEVSRPGIDAWPIAPLEPGLGELTALNIYVTHITNAVWNGSRRFYGVARSFYDEFKKMIDGGRDLDVFPVDEIHLDIQKQVMAMDQSSLQADVWRIVEALSEIFERRVGLSELHYGRNPGGKVSRSAADAQTKREGISIRPEHMALQVETWMTELARMEKMVARFAVEPQHVSEILGPVEGMLWQQLITMQPVEQTVREMEATVEAGSVRKPNKDREAANMQQVMQPALAVLQQYAQATSDTGPLNELFMQFGDSIDKDMRRLQIGPWQPPPPPPEIQQQQQMEMQMQMQQQQQQQQLEQMKMQAEVEQNQVKTQQLMAKAQADAAKAQIAEQQKMANQVEAEARLRSEQASARQRLRSSEESHDQKTRHAEEIHDQRFRHSESEHRQDIVHENDGHEQDLRHGESGHRQEMSQARAKNRMAILSASKNGKTNGEKKEKE